MLRLHMVTKMKKKIYVCRIFMIIYEFNLKRVKGKHITPIDVKIFGDKALETDATIYPSDHMGLTAELAFDFN